FDKKVFDRGGQGPKNCYKSHGCVSKFVKIRKLLSENLKNLCQKRSASAGGRSARNPFVWFFRKKSTGVAILETALTLPVVLYIVFFSIELIRMELAQTAVDSITKEFTFYLMAKGKIVQSEVDAIFNKYRPWGIPIGRFRFTISMYSNFHTDDDKGLMDISPYGGATIFWLGEDYNNPNPDMSPAYRARQAFYGRGNTGSQVLFSKYQGGTGSTVDGSKTRKLLDGNEPSSGYIFILTVAVNFPFSSPFTKKLFNGGSNTVKLNGSKADVYILWARGSGMIN
ncbi:MAG: pilus assembly protein, partial [Alphaproteobacteria bacterium]|nr:pilus assembly protein [Alphaproteobacteria bacterium]